MSKHGVDVWKLHNQRLEAFLSRSLLYFSSFSFLFVRVFLYHEERKGSFILSSLKGTHIHLIWSNNLHQFLTRPIHNCILSFKLFISCCITLCVKMPYLRCEATNVIDLSLVTTPLLHAIWA